MQDCEYFRIVHRATHCTRLKAPKAFRSGDRLAAIALRLKLCDGVEDVLVKPGTSSVIVRHAPDFCWSSIGHDLIPLPSEASPVPARPALPAPARSAERPARQAWRVSIQDVALWAVGAAISRQPAAHLVQELALSVLANALRDARRA